MRANCRHPHKAEAVVRVHVPEGCWCFPGDRYQWLCAQHLAKLDHAPYRILIDLRKAAHDEQS